MRTMMNNWIKFSIAFVAAISLASSSFAQDQSDEPVKEQSPRQKLVTKKRLNTIAKTQSPVEGFSSVDLFQAMDHGEIKVIIRNKDAASANLIVENKTDKPLAIRMPPAFSCVPVMRQGGAGAPGMGGGGMGGGGKQIGSQGAHKKNLLDAWRLDSKTAENVREALDSSYKFEIDVPLSGLSKALSDLTGQPILLNQRAVKQANQDLDMPIKYSREMIPLRAAMRQMLQPLYLRASIENDGIVISADHAALAKEGIGTDAWINVDQEMEQDFSAKLEQKGVFEFIDIPLRECIRSLAAKFELKMIIREADLEDIG